MLKRLSVENYALIESLDMQLDDHLNIITGQTGAGKSILLGALGLVIFLVLSFTTQMWYITWLVFPIMGAVKGLVSAILDLKEALKHEN